MPCTSASFTRHSFASARRADATPRVDPAPSAVPAPAPAIKLPTSQWRPAADEAGSVWWTEASRRVAGTAAADDFRAVPASEWRDTRPPPPPPRARWEASLCGGRVLEVDLRTADGLSAARAAVAAPKLAALNK